MSNISRSTFERRAQFRGSPNPAAAANPKCDGSNLEKITYSRLSGICFVAVAPNVSLVKKRKKKEKRRKKITDEKKKERRNLSERRINSPELSKGFDRTPRPSIHRTQILKHSLCAYKREDAAHTMTSTTNLYKQIKPFCSLYIYVSAHGHAHVTCRNGVKRRARNSENLRIVT